MNNKEETENKTSYQRLPNIPKELHTKLKVFCAKKDITMRKAAIDAVKRYLKREDK